MSNAFSSHTMENLLEMKKNFPSLFLHYDGELEIQTFARFSTLWSRRMTRWVGTRNRKSPSGWAQQASFGVKEKTLCFADTHESFSILFSFFVPFFFVLHLTLPFWYDCSTFVSDNSCDIPHPSFFVEARIMRELNKKNCNKKCNVCPT